MIAHFYCLLVKITILFSRYGKNVEIINSITYMNLTKEDDDARDKLKTRIIERLVRKNECMKNEIQFEDDLRVVQVRKTSKNKKHKHVTLTCSPHIRKIIKDNNDQLYFESQVYRVYDSYHVVICHHCQKLVT